jgi:hypothetical protein
MKKKSQKEHKKRYDPVESPDSIWQRSSSNTGGKKKSLGGKEIMHMLGIDHEDEPASVQDKSPLKMMDIVMQTWDVGDEEEHEEEEGEEEEEHEEE